LSIYDEGHSNPLGCGVQAFVMLKDFRFTMAKYMDHMMLRAQPTGDDCWINYAVFQYS
jgi:hypothetical protein